MEVFALKKSLDSVRFHEITLGEEDVTVQEFNKNLRFTSSIQPNTPAIDAQERGIFRNRVISHHDGSESYVGQG